MAEDRDVPHVTSYKKPLPEEERQRLRAEAAEFAELAESITRAFKGVQQEAYVEWAQSQAAGTTTDRRGC